LLENETLAARGVVLRAARGEDAAFERELFAAARPDIALLEAAFPPEARAAFLDQQFQFQTISYARMHPDAQRLVVLADGIPAGRLILDSAADGWCLVDIALMPACRGRGLGTLIVQAILEEAGRADAPGVRLSVVCDSPARRLYERLGFVVVSEAVPNAAMEWRPQCSQLKTA
jgi:ribosomal protein S18 acetylase RimI-like enzyme